MKASFYPEYAIVVWATRILGKPVKWIEDRSEAHQTDYHGRDNVTGLDDSSDRVKPLPKPMPLPDNEPVKPKPKPTDSGLEKIQKDADDLLETKIIETDGGVSVDVGDAAAGGAITSIPMLGLGLLRRRFLL